jgi:hypothetical protein
MPEVRQTDFTSRKESMICSTFLPVRTDSSSEVSGSINVEAMIEPSST